MEEKMTVRVRRSNPSIGTGSHFQVYEVSIISGFSVMDVLDYIYENLDGTLAYRSHAACRRGVCGKCMVLINGKPGLLCQTSMEGDITLEPPPKSVVIKDLIWEIPPES